MGFPLDELSPGARVAVIRLRSLGDCVLTTPALHLLKRHRPDLEIGVAVEPAFAPIFEGNPDVAAILAPTVRAVRGWRASLCLNLHGGTRSARLTALSGARFRAGFAHFRFSAVYNLRIPRAQEILGVERKVHTAEHAASAVFYLGAPSTEIPRARLFATEQLEPEAPYAVLHPFASAPDKTWPAERFIALARELTMARSASRPIPSRDREGAVVPQQATLGSGSALECIFIAGPHDDITPFREFRAVAGASLSQVKALLSRASLFIGNDSGPAHMAAAFGVPSVVLFGNSDHEVWAPWRAPAETIVARGPIANVLLAEVLAAVERLKVAA